MLSGWGAGVLPALKPPNGVDAGAGVAAAGCVEALNANEGADDFAGVPNMLAPSVEAGLDVSVLPKEKTGAGEGAADSSCADEAPLSFGYETWSLADWDAGAGDAGVDDPGRDRFPKGLAGADVDGGCVAVVLWPKMEGDGAAGVVVVAEVPWPKTGAAVVAGVLCPKGEAAADWVGVVDDEPRTSLSSFC